MHSFQNHWFRFLALSTLIAGFITYGEARPNRPTLIPNGAVNNCANCHINPAGGGARNEFGQAVEELIFQGAGDDFWGEELALIDSDGDGFTNGEELLDPEGTWRPGDPDPGNPEDVTLPGNPDSTPPVQRNAYAAYLHGSNVIPSVNTESTGVAILTIDEQNLTLNYHLYVYNIENVFASHIHLGAEGENGPVAIPLEPPEEGQSSGEVSLSEDNLSNLNEGLFYVNVHTDEYPDGEIRGQLMDEPLAFKATLSGSQVVDPVETDASGEATLTLNEDLTTLSYTLTITDIEEVTAAHIHLGARGVSGDVIFPIADSSFETTSGEIELDEEQLDHLLSREYYFMVHTSQNPGGEIRGQIEFDPEEFIDETTIKRWFFMK